MTEQYEEKTEAEEDQGSSSKVSQNFLSMLKDSESDSNYEAQQEESNQPETDSSRQQDADTGSESPKSDFEPRRVEKGKNNNYRLGIIGGPGTGKTAYLYTLGLLKTSINRPINGWMIEQFSREYSMFFSRADSRDFQSDWTGTPFDDLNVFDMFSVIKDNLQIEVGAFDAGGENLEAAIDPYKGQKIPKGSSSYDAMIMLKNEILSCDGYIFLVNGELTDPNYLSMLKERREYPMMPDRLLLHLSNLLKIEHKIPPGKPIGTPIAFALTKGDIADNRDRLLPGFMALKNTRAESAAEQRQKEAESYIERYFPQLFQVANDFPRKSFHVISCWGNEPVYMIGAREESGSLDTVDRHESYKLRKNGHSVAVCVEDVDPVGIEEPLVAVLEEIKESARQRKKTKLMKYCIWGFVAFLVLAFYPLFSYPGGKALQSKGFDRAAAYAYHLTEYHPVSNFSFMEKALSENYVHIMNSLKASGDLKAATNLSLHLFEFSMKASGLEPESLEEIRTGTSDLIYKQSRQLVNAGDYHEALSYLGFLSRHNLNAERENRLSTRSHLRLAGMQLANRSTSNAMESLHLAVGYFDGGQEETEEMMEILDRLTGALTADAMMEIYRRVIETGKMPQLALEKIARSLAVLGVAPVGRKDTAEALRLLKKAYDIMPQRITEIAIAEEMKQYVSETGNKNDALVFLNEFRRQIIDLADIRHLEAAIVFDLFRAHLRSGDPATGLSLVNNRGWLSDYLQYPKYVNHAGKALHMAFVPAGQGMDAYYIDKFEVINRDYKEAVSRTESLTPQYWGTAQYAEYSPNPDGPVIYVSWHQAKTYCEMVGKRLPSIREWERAWGDNHYPWGDGFSPAYSNTREAGEGRAVSVHSALGSKDCSEFGVCHLAGNVSEFTENTVRDDSGRVRALVKGENFIGYGADRDIKNQTRKIYVEARQAGIGFRCAMYTLP